MTPTSFYSAYLPTLVVILLGGSLVACDSGPANSYAGLEVVITEPANYAVLSSTTLIRVDVTSDEGIEFVSFFIDEEVIGSDSLLPYTVEWDVAYWSSDTLHTIDASATDGLGNVEYARPIKVSIDPTASLTPALVGPGHRTTIYKMDPQPFIWRAFKDAIEYEMEISKSLDPSIPGHSLFTNDTLISSSKIPSEHFGRTNYWRVRARGHAGSWSRWSKRYNIDLLNITHTFEYHGHPNLQRTGEGWIRLYSKDASHHYSLLFATVDESSNILNQRTLGSFDKSSSSQSVHLTDEDHFVIAGSMTFYRRPYWTRKRDQDAWLRRINVHTDATWFQTYGQEGIDEIGLGATQTADEGLLMIGAKGISGEKKNAWLVRTDGAGGIHWTRVFRDDDEIWISNVIPFENAHFLIAGKSPCTTGSEETLCFTLLEIDRNGKTVWRQSHASGNLHRIKTTTDGGFIGIGNKANQLWLVKIDFQGFIEWEINWGGPRFDEGNDVIETHDGDYVAIGTTQSYGAGSYDVLLLKVSSLGIEIWYRTYGEIFHDRGTSLVQTLDDGFILTGSTQKLVGLRSFSFLIKIDTEGHMVY